MAVGRVRVQQRCGGQRCCAGWIWARYGLTAINFNGDAVLLQCMEMDAAAPTPSSARLWHHHDGWSQDGTIVGDSTMDAGDAEAAVVR